MLNIQSYVTKHYLHVCNIKSPFLSYEFQANQWFCITRVVCSWEFEFFATGQSEHPVAPGRERQIPWQRWVSIWMTPTVTTQAQLSAKLPAMAVVKPTAVMGRACLCWTGFPICTAVSIPISPWAAWGSDSVWFLSAECHLDFSPMTCDLLRVSITSWQCLACQTLLFNGDYRHDSSHGCRGTDEG